MPSVLIVDDLLSIHEMLEAVIQPTGYSTAFATDGEKALARYKVEKYDLVLADIDMKPMDGITLLRQLKTYDPSAVVIIMTAYASSESAVQALKYGAFDYLQKPFRVDDLIATLKRALDYRKFSVTASAAVAAGTAAAPAGVLDIDARLVGVSVAHKKLLAQIKKLATVRTPVLLQGETGTGKTTIAELLHAGTAGADSPVVRVDCSRSAEPSFRISLFGENDEGGLWITQARGGTLLLQNLEKLDAGMQHDLVAILRAHIQSMRLICTSAEDLERLTEEGRFNDELFYRVASLPLQIPPLRERSEDVPQLVKFFTAQAANPNFDAKLIEFAPDALAALKAYSWPGNITDLGQVILKIAGSCDSRMIGVEQLPMRLKDLGGWPKLAEFLALQEKHYIEQVLHACRGDKTQAARVLGVEKARLG
jgi:two-component system, NtrC family, response regulator HydG